MTSYDPNPPASTADLAHQGQLQTLLGRVRVLETDGSLAVLIKVLQLMPGVLRNLAEAEKGDRERIGRLEAENENLRHENDLLRALTRPAALPPRLPPPPLPGEQQVEDIDIEAMEDAFEDVRPDLREITRDFESKIYEAIRNLEKKEKK